MQKKLMGCIIAGVVMSVSSAGGMNNTTPTTKRTIMQVEESDSMQPKWPDAPRKKARVMALVPLCPVKPMEQIFSNDMDAMPQLERSFDITDIDVLQNNLGDDCHRFLSLLVARESVDKVCQALTRFPHLMASKNDNGDTLLHAAVRMRSVWYVELLCIKGAHVLEPNHVGESPLSIAEGQENNAVLSILNRYKPVSRSIFGY